MSSSPEISTRRVESLSWIATLRALPSAPAAGVEEVNSEFPTICSVYPRPATP